MIQFVGRSFFLGAMIGVAISVALWWREWVGPSPMPAGVPTFQQTPTWETCVYDVRDLINALPDFSGPSNCFVWPADDRSSQRVETEVTQPPIVCTHVGALHTTDPSERSEKVHDLIVILQNATADTVVLSGESPAFRELGGQLIITHTPAAHRRVAADLESIRLAPGRRLAFTAALKSAVIGGVIGAALAWAVPGLRLHRRRQSGLCLQCGYDLRATTDRCPECGTQMA